MSQVTEELDWDDVLGEVDKVEEERKKEGKSDNDFEALPAGPYPIVVQDAEKMVSSTGKDMIKVKVQVTEGPYVNRTLFNYIVFSKDNPKAMRLTLERLAAFGLTREYIATQKPSPAAIAELLVGLTATAVVGIQGKEAGEYAGRNEIKAFRPLAGAAPVAPSAPKPAGVPDIPRPDVPEAASTPTPSVPVPQVPVADAADAADPFG